MAARRPKPAPQASVAAAADLDRRAFLVANRTRIAQAIDSPDISPRDLAALTRRVLEIDKEVRALDLAAEQEAADAYAAAENETWDPEAI